MLVRHLQIAGVDALRVEGSGREDNRVVGWTSLEQVDEVLNGHGTKRWVMSSWARVSSMVDWRFMGIRILEMGAGVV